jgi:cyclomaltodextrinase / maltogenic alpha-amylase / neopullulanase
MAKKRFQSIGNLTSLRVLQKAGRGNLLMTKYFVVLILFLSSCETSKPVSFNDQELIKGNASPIIVENGISEINLEDYVIDVSKIDSVTAPPELRKNQAKNTLALEGELVTKISSIKLWHHGQAYAIPLQKANKKSISLNYSGEAKEVRTKGEFNAWNPQNSLFTKSENGFTFSMSLPPGNYQYLFLVDGKEKRDPSNKDSIDNGMGGWNSVIRIPRPAIEKLPILSTKSCQGKTIQLSLSNPAKEVMVFWKNFLLDYRSVKLTEKQIDIILPSEAAKETRSFIRVWAANDEGISNDVLIPLNNGEVLTDASLLTRQDKEAQILYFMMIDRFNNAKKENDQPVKDKNILPKANYYGGDIAGVTQKIKDGYFSSLGINTLWLSPITLNPKGAYGKYTDPVTTFSGYHGYWPVSLQQIDYRFGTKADMKKLIDEAHKQNINVILDYVAHHVHQEHPLVKLKPEWFTPLYLPDGTINTERWDDQRLTTWFDVFMPTLDLRKPEVVSPMTDTALYWLKNYELDGFRHDASKHIDLLFWRTLSKKIKSEIDRPIYQIGETYGSRELVNSYVNTGMLDGQFDFNVYDDAVNTFARNDVPFSRLSSSVTESMSWFGDHHLMGNITGNQDRARFISYADGSVRFDEDAKRAGWKRKIEIKDTIGYNKLQSLTAFMMTIPGVPVIYYGDEIGDPGGNDPDNRRMMRFDKLSPFENKTKEISQKLVGLRKNSMALVYGDFQWLKVEEQVLVYKRSYFGNQVIIAFNKSGQSKEIDLGALPKSATTHFTGKLQFENSEAKLTLKPQSFEVIEVNY